MAMLNNQMVNYLVDRFLYYGWNYDPPCHPGVKWPEGMFPIFYQMVTIIINHY